MSPGGHSPLPPAAAAAGHSHGSAKPDVFTLGCPKHAPTRRFTRRAARTAARAAGSARRQPPLPAPHRAAQHRPCRQHPNASAPAARLGVSQRLPITDNKRRELLYIFYNKKKCTPDCYSSHGEKGGFSSKDSRFSSHLGKTYRRYGANWPVFRNLKYFQLIPLARRRVKGKKEAPRQ